MGTKKATFGNPMLNSISVSFSDWLRFLIQITQPDSKKIHPNTPKIRSYSNRQCSKKYKLLTSHHRFSFKLHGVRLGACIFWNIFGPKNDRILSVFRVYFFRVQLGKNNYLMGSLIDEKLYFRNFVSDKIS
jgi:hypothetical protein